MQLSPGFNRLPSGADMNLELMYPDRAIIALDDLNYLCLPITKVWLYLGTKFALIIDL